MSKVLHVQNDFPGAAKGPKIASESKNAIFSKSKIMIPQSDWGKRKVKLMLQFDSSSRSVKKIIGNFFIGALIRNFISNQDDPRSN